MEDTTQTFDKLDVGINSSMPSNRVMWSTGRNVRFTPGYVEKTLGKTPLATLSPASLDIREMFTFMGIDGNMYTIICCDAHVYIGDSNLSQITDITPTSPAPTGGAADFWEFTIVSGLPLLTNGKNAIWQLPAYGQRLTNSNLPIAKNIGCCMHRLVMSNVAQGGKFNTGRVVWSEMGNPLNIAVDTSKKAGYHDLIDYTAGHMANHNIIAQVSIDSKVIFFTLSNVWECDFSKSIKQFVIIDSGFQLLSNRAVCVHEGVIYAINQRDVWTFLGGTKTPIGLPIKKELFAAMNQTGKKYIFAFPMFGANEIWFCFSTGNNTGLPDTAYIYNWELKAWTIQDCDFNCHALLYAPSEYVAWTNSAGATVSWTDSSSNTTNWSPKIEARYNALAKDICGDSLSNILQMDSGYNAFGFGSLVLNSESGLELIAEDNSPLLSESLTATIYGYIETGDMALSARHVEKIIEHMFLDIDSQAETNSLMIQVGTRATLSSPLKWSIPVPFRIGSDMYADLRGYGNQGVYVRFRFYTSALDSPWRMSLFTILYALGGRIR